MSKHRKNPGPVPNRWLHCPRKSNQLIVEKFMAIKTPLSADFDSQIPPDCRFYPKMVFDICKTKKVNLGLWVDLTNTSRFYDEEEIKQQDCWYVKINCRGHGETPSKEQTDTFIKLVHNFISKFPLKNIVVHCTHGFNRTGFMLVSYMVEKMDMSLELAVETFAAARPVGIYKQDYLEELYRRYDDIEDVPQAPPLPDWCTESDDSQNNCDDEIEEGASTSTSMENQSNKPKSNRNKKEVKFMEGISGVLPFEEQPKANGLLKKVQKMCGWKGRGFPGCQPVSMDITNLKLLHEKPYQVSWKADGTRYMMLIDGENEIYFFDRDYNIFKVEGVRFVRKSNLRIHLKNTLLDGEMVIDVVEGKSIPRYLAYDIIMFEGDDVGKKPFAPTRLFILESEIIQPRHMAMHHGLINKNLEPFSVRKKDFWHVKKAASLLSEKFTKGLSHEPDGLIFQPSKEPYITGRCDEVLKWKPLDMNSIDFRLKILKEGGTGIVTQRVGFLYVGSLDRPFAKMKYTKALKELDNKVIECKYEDNQWKFMRERTDKSYPNSYDTAKAVWGSIQNPITKEKLLQFIDRYSYDDDREVMPPPPKIRR